MADLLAGRGAALQVGFGVSVSTWRGSSVFFGLRILFYALGYKKSVGFGAVF